jgi:hypothetical protein
MSGWVRIALEAVAVTAVGILLDRALVTYVGRPYWANFDRVGFYFGVWPYLTALAGVLALRFRRPASAATLTLAGGLPAVAGFAYFAFYQLALWSDDLGGSLLGLLAIPALAALANGWVFRRACRSGASGRS